MDSKGPSSSHGLLHWLRGGGLFDFDLTLCIFGFLGRVLTLAPAGDEILLVSFQGLYDQVPSYPITYNIRETSDQYLLHWVMESLYLTHTTNSPVIYNGWLVTDSISKEVLQEVSIDMTT